MFFIISCTKKSATQSKLHKLSCSICRHHTTHVTIPANNLCCKLTSETALIAGMWFNDCNIVKITNISVIKSHGKAAKNCRLLPPRSVAADHKHTTDSKWCGDDDDDCHRFLYKTINRQPCAISHSHQRCHFYIYILFFKTDFICRFFSVHRWC